MSEQSRMQVHKLSPGSREGLAKPRDGQETAERSTHRHAWRLDVCDGLSCAEHCSAASHVPFHLPGWMHTSASSAHDLRAHTQNAAGAMPKSSPGTPARSCRQPARSKTR